MSENKNRLSGQPADAQRPEQNTPAAESAEDILARINVDEIGFPPDLVENILSDLESSAAAVAPAVETPEPPTDKPSAAPAPSSEPVEAQPQAEAPAAQAPAAETAAEQSETEAEPAQPEPAAPQEQADTEAAAQPEQTAEQAPAESEPAEAQPEDNTETVADETPASDQNEAESTEATEAPEQAPEQSEAESEQPPVTETALTVSDANTDETAGMTLIERAKYHARMRRREQTRLRRENARREAAGGEAVYQPMSPIDMRLTLIRLGIAAIFLVAGLLLRQAGVAFALYLIAYLITVLPVAAKVAYHFTHGKYFDEYLLILIASLGAFLLRHYPEASLVLILHSAGQIAGDLVLSSTHKSMTRQTITVPDKASLVNMKGEEHQVSPKEIRIGNFVLVRSGERIPIDGVVLRGEGTVDDAVLTGDSEPLQVEKDIHVLAGGIYTGSLMLLRATARFEDCAINQILHMQEEGRERKASLEKSVTNGAARFIPIMVVLAVLLSVIPPLFNSGTSITEWVYRALSILVVCCPTALLISVPLCFLCGNGRLSQKGIHVKGSEAIEKLAELRMAVFDKTGTLTEGNLRVKEIQATHDFNQESCLALAAAAEQLSRHPVARAVVAAYEGKPQKISEFEEFPGRGVRARIGNRNLLVGNRRLMVSRGVKGVPEIRGTVVYVAYEGDYAGAIVLEDTIRSEASEAIKGLKSQGVLRTVILTGDTESPAQQTADAIGIDTVHYGLQPEEKASKMEFLMRTIPTDGTSAYVGDGVNDLDELGMADVGVAMGAAGSQQTAAAANVLILTSNLNRLTDAMRISRRTHGIAMQNMTFVLLIKLLLVLLTVLGVTYMWQAVAIDVLLTVLTVLNSARILGIK
ncbi:MAG TPA: cadmium-translocating P-type ATPase [Candidatus Agathobaculum intestinigallinarum]|nr:cadmium-translocating P-type ATPase [Candidatus Agathobaculum intestinigallinarum]